MMCWIRLYLAKFQLTTPPIPPPPTPFSSAAYMRRWTGSALIQVMAYHLFDAKQLHEPMLWRLVFPAFKWILLRVYLSKYVGKNVFHIQVRKILLSVICVHDYVIHRCQNNWSNISFTFKLFTCAQVPSQHFFSSASTCYMRVGLFLTDAHSPRRTLCYRCLSGSDSTHTPDCF